MSKPYLLLVEDDKDDVFLTIRTLRRNGFPAPIRDVSDGVEALAFLRDAPTLPLVVLLSWRLPRMNSGEVIGLLREDEQTRSVPIVVLTGSVEERERLCDGGSENTTGADDCLTKPLSWPAFVTALQKLGTLPAVRADARAFLR